MGTELNTFDLLEKNVAKLAKSRFKQPTEIQKRAIPHVLDGENCLLISQTGSGKLESSFLPLLSNLVQKESKPISILYICPLRSLNRDILDRMLWWGNELDLDISVRHGDTTQYERGKQVQNPPEILITTPETLQSMLVGTRLREHLKNIKSIIIDEIHELVTNKRGVQLAVGLERLKELITSSGGKTPQIVGLSATVGSPEEVANFIGIEKVIDSERKRGISILVESPNPTKEDRKLSNKLNLVPEVVARLELINKKIKEKDSVLVFTNTRQASEVLSSRLKVLGSSLETHHSSLSKETRIDVEKGFKNKDIKSLVATSSLELGIDIGSIDYVIQYMSPRQVTKMLQRLGRSGHSVDKKSEGMIIASDNDDYFESTVIADLATQHKIEETKVYTKSLDVLAHQIIGLSLEYYDFPLKKAFEIITKAYPFRELSEIEFLDVCEFLKNLWLIWINNEGKENRVTDFGDTLRRRKKAWEYYYQNLSTIPDTKNYNVINIVNNKSIGFLDEAFVSIRGTAGSYVIFKGQPWRIVDVTGRKITVEPATTLDANIPSWEGELIPIELIVAENVGRLRGDIESLLPKSKKEIISHLMQKYPITKEVAEKLHSIVKQQKDFGFVPTDKKIVIEYGPFGVTKEEAFVVIIHTCFGSNINATIGRVLSHTLTEQIGSVGLHTDAYRIIIKLASPVYKKVIDSIYKISTDNIENIIESEIINDELFNWKFIHVAKRFGIIKKDADYGKAYFKKIIEVYQNSPATREVLNEIKTEKMDIEKSKKCIKILKKADIRIQEGISPIGSFGLDIKYEIIPGNSEFEVLKIFKDRLESTTLGFVCVNCSWNIKVPAENAYLECRQCKSMISVVPKNYIEECSKLIKDYKGGKPIPKSNLPYLDKILTSASLVKEHGKKAVLCLAARGVGTATASRILRKPVDGDDLLKEILEAEKNFAKTKKFWK